MIAAFAVSLRREWRLAMRQKGDWLMPPLFYLIVITLFALGGKPNDPHIAAFAPAILWMGALLSALLTLDRLFRPDFEDGTLEQCFLSTVGPLTVVYAKLIAHWLLTGMPLSLLAAPLALQLGAAPAMLPTLVAALLLGTPMLSLIGGFAAALTVGLPRAGVLLPVLVLPLIGPIVIFGAGAARSAAAGLSAAGPLYLLGSLLLLGLCLLPIAATAALRNSFD
jgi:heme exporter protein B